LDFEIDFLGEERSVVSVVVDDLSNGLCRCICIYAAVRDAEGVDVDGFASQSFVIDSCVLVQDVTC
jgi:hypothetical protein